VPCCCCCDCRKSRRYSFRSGGFDMIWLIGEVLIIQKDAVII
jgi:hypothetical protein